MKRLYADATTIMTRPDLDRLDAMCTSLFGLLPEDNEWTTILLQV
jgi:hypothetical protein